MGKKRDLGIFIVVMVIGLAAIAVVTSVSNQPTAEEQSGENWIGIMDANLKLCQLIDSLDDLQDLDESLNMELPILYQEMPRFTDRHVLQLNSIAEEIDACLQQKITLYVP